MKDFLREHQIEYYAFLPLSKTKILKEYLLTNSGFSSRDNLLIMLFPYRSELLPCNLSVYASVPDYHRFVTQFGAEFESFMAKKYPTHRFKTFTDHSPVDEVYSACISGLGMIGDNGLLINEKYSSFVFIGECVTDLTPKECGLDFSPVSEVKTCLHCGACANACPSRCIGEKLDKQKECLSAITQKKGTLSPDEIALMNCYHTVWGCDVCQNVCPYTKSASFTPIPYFSDGVIQTLSVDLLEKMSEEEFLSRPFSWRGKETILRNLIYEKEQR